MEDKLYLLLPLLILLLLGSHLIRVSNIFFVLFFFCSPHTVTVWPEHLGECFIALLLLQQNICVKKVVLPIPLYQTSVCVCVRARNKRRNHAENGAAKIFSSASFHLPGVWPPIVSWWSDWIINDAIYVCEKDIFTISSSLQRTNNECLRVLLCCIFTCVTREFCPNFK